MTALIDQGAHLFSRLLLGGRKRITVPAGALPILSPGALLAAPQRQALLRQLDTLVSVSEAHYETLYVAAVESFAKLVQQLPASEAHHHAGKGGLLDHSLEVAVIALQLRRGYLLPPGVAPEDQARLQDLWTYAVFTAALVHDLGKPVVDQRVQLFDDRGQSAGIWDPWQGSIPEPPLAHALKMQRAYPDMPEPQTRLASARLASAYLRELGGAAYLPLPMVASAHACIGSPERRYFRAASMPSTRCVPATKR